MIDEKKLIDELKQSGMIADNEYGNAMVDMIESQPQISSCKVMEALKKQIPIEIKDIHVDEYYCPACGSENGCDDKVVTDNYCPICGQKIFQKE